MQAEAAVGIGPAARVNGRRGQSARRNATRWARIIYSFQMAELQVGRCDFT